ncbi:MAG: class I SAM-dependent RNA methyltransferase [Clostridia bacterium]|nr:class I SAM-dependent RNA methyltransferase [Clostridia bacterium]
MEIQVACGFGMETATKLELKRLGYDAPCIDGRFELKGDSRDIVSLNLHLRTADRVLITLKKFTATTFDELFDGVSEIDWANYLPRNGFIAVNAKSIKSTLFALSSIQSITKKAIVNVMLKTYPSLPEDGDRFCVEVNVLRDEVTISLDTSGAGLHKRGYRKLVWEAPIKETLASGIIELSGWRGDRAVIDPFTGSGTFPIECCMRALSIPSGYFREFAFEKYPFIDSNILKEEKQIAKDGIEWDKKVRISGFDIKGKAIGIAYQSAKEFGLEKYIHFETQDMRNISSRYEGGMIFANPPYGERLGTKEEIEVLYRDFGRVFRSLKDWGANVITSCPQFERLFARSADRERKVYNAKLLCRIYTYFPQKK